MGSQDMNKMGSYTPCGVCKYLGRRCTEDCVYVSYFPPDSVQKLGNAREVLGETTVAKLMNELNANQLQQVIDCANLRFNMWQFYRVAQQFVESVGKNLADFFGQNCPSYRLHHQQQQNVGVSVHQMPHHYKQHMMFPVYQMPHHYKQHMMVPVWGNLMIRPQPQQQQQQQQVSETQSSAAPVASSTEEDMSNDSATSTCRLKENGDTMSME